MKKKGIPIVKKAGTAIAVAACLFSVIVPFARKIGQSDRYECVWEDGSVTYESYASAYRSLIGMDRESVLLYRDGMTGKIKSGATRTYETLDTGSLTEILNCRAEGTQLDIAALYRTFSSRVWYDGNYYVWTGRSIRRVSAAERSELVVLGGTVGSRVLRESGATTVYLHGSAEVRAYAFARSSVETLHAQPPYTVSGGALYLDTLGGKRLVAAVGGTEQLVVDGDTEFADEGALLACDGLVSLTVPFSGSAKSPYGSEYRGELAHLFSLGKEYRVPQTLTSVTVTGGRLVSHAFYACENLKEIDACRVPASEISQMAFAGLERLEVLHTPRADVTLTGSFAATIAECGCTEYRRIYSQN